MSKYIVILMLAFSTLFIATPSRSDAPSLQPASSFKPSPEAPPEPITGTAVMPAPGSESTPKDPFSPYGIGPGPTAKTPKPFWSYSDLTAGEKAVADRNRDVTGWEKIHGAYNTAVQEQAQRAVAGAAQHELGADSLLGIGVVP